MDITLSDKYANICGIEVERLEEHFSEHIENLTAQKHFTHYESVYEEILSWYDGYSWDGETKVINPFSLLNFLSLKKFSGFWYASGSPKFLVDLIKKRPEAYTNLNDMIVTSQMLDSVQISNVAVEPLLFQTDYLTVEEVLYDMGEVAYLLRIPNYEVEKAFNLHVLSALTESDDVRAGQARIKIYQAMREGNLEEILGVLRGLLASIPYQLHVDAESYYHSIFYAIMNVMGFDIDAEVSTSKGRVDAILELDDKVYIFEFKYIKPKPEVSAEDKLKHFKNALEEAMSQINDRGYAKKYTGSGKTVYQAAFAFQGRDEIEMLMETN
jgi:hypothetical protein